MLMEKVVSYSGTKNHTFYVGPSWIEQRWKTKENDNFYLDETSWYLNNMNSLDVWTVCWSYNFDVPNPCMQTNR